VLKAINSDSVCAKTKLFSCGGQNGSGENLYRIDSTAPLFPKEPSLERAFIENIGLDIRLLRQGQVTSSPTETDDFKTLGAFRFRLADHTPETWFLMVNTDWSYLTLIVQNYELPDSLPISSGVYSLVDFMPGIIAARPTEDTNKVFHALGNHEYDKKQAVIALGVLHKALSVRRVSLSFKYPKGIVIAEPFSASCSGDTNFVAIRLPDVDQSGTSGDSVTQLSEANQKRLCAQLYKGDFANE
jgi:hypothetical protein